MRRSSRCVAMVAVGLSLLVCYGGAAYLLSLFVASLVRNSPDLMVSLAVTVGMTLAVGYLNYRLGTLSVVAGLDATELARAGATGLYVRVDRLCDRLDLDSPRLLVADLTFPNALALGGAGGGIVVFDYTLFWLLDPDELEVIVAHELAHLESGDSLIQTLVYTAGRTVVGSLLLGILPITLTLTGLARGLAWVRGRPAEWDATPVLWLRRSLERGVLIALVGFTLLLRAHSRRREYAAADRAATVTGDPLALARALRKIQRVSEPYSGPLGRLSVPDQETALGRLFSTHPPMEDRIRRLVDRSEASNRPVSTH